MSLAGDFLDEAMQSELKKFDEEKCVRLIPRDEARNLISCRMVLRWNPIKPPLPDLRHCELRAASVTRRVAGV